MADGIERTIRKIADIPLQLLGVNMQFYKEEAERLERQLAKLEGRGTAPEPTPSTPAPKQSATSQS